MTEFSKRLQKAMSVNNISQTELCKKTNIPKSAISQYISGSFKPKQTRTYIIANTLGVNPAWLMGFDVPMYAKSQDDFNVFDIENIKPAPQTVKKPRLGVIACGEPILAEENIENYDDVPIDINCDFTLLCNGDSMINARIKDGDIVYIREQPEVDNGEIAACLVDGDFETNATLKRFFKYEDKIVLQAENPKYPPFVYVNEEMNKVRVIGKAVGFTSPL